MSSDTHMACRIGELDDLCFLSNSDCHSPWPHRLGREFNRLKLKNLGFKEIMKALKNEGGRGMMLNVGLNPLEGKYHLTACIRCYKPFHLEDALGLRMRCPECRGLIKKGVSDRAGELAGREDCGGVERPPYLHILPLAEVLSLSLGVKTLTSKKIQEHWEKLVESFGSEINVLVDEKVEEIMRLDADAGKIIQRFRQKRMHYNPGGGGRYGTPSLKKVEPDYYGRGQKRLGQYE